MTELVDLIESGQIVPVKQIGKAQFAYCAECDHWLGSPYWSLSKSVALHKRGTGHEVVLYAFTEVVPT